MDNRETGSFPNEPTRVIYTCWPFGGILCGIGTIGIGTLLLADHFFAASPEVLWGIGLIVFGAAIVWWSRTRGERWS